MFQILDYLPKLEEYGQLKENLTWINATCPICGGKLKISKNPSKYGSYACYTNNCHSKNNTNLIRKLLYRNRPFQTSRAFIPSRPPQSKLISLVETKPITSSIDSFKSSAKFVPPEQLVLENKTYTYFLYDEFRIVRTDFKDKNEPKTFFPEQYIRGKWRQGLPDDLKLLPVYRSDYFQSNVIMVEGEKAATIGQLLGMACITVPTFSWSETILIQYMKEFKEHHQLENIIYLRDNDDAGVFKSDLVSLTAWKNDIGCVVKNLADILKVNRLGYDLYDAYRDRLITKHNWINILSE